MGECKSGYMDTPVYLLFACYIYRTGFCFPVVDDCALNFKVT